MTKRVRRSLKGLKPLSKPVFSTSFPIFDRITPSPRLFQLEIKESSFPPLCHSLPFAPPHPPACLFIPPSNNSPNVHPPLPTVITQTPSHHLAQGMIECSADFCWFPHPCLICAPPGSQSDLFKITYYIMLLFCQKPSRVLIMILLPLQTYQVCDLT